MTTMTPPSSIRCLTRISAQYEASDLSEFATEVLNHLFKLNVLHPSEQNGKLTFVIAIFSRLTKATWESYNIPWSAVVN